MAASDIIQYASTLQNFSATACGYTNIVHGKYGVVATRFDCRRLEACWESVRAQKTMALM